MADLVSHANLLIVFRGGNAHFTGKISLSIPG